MKKTLSQTNKDLDLRRFGKDVYSKALGEGGSGEITEDDVIKYYTNGRYSKKEDIDSITILGSDYTEYSLGESDEIFGEPLCWRTNLIVNATLPVSSISILEPKSEGDFVFINGNLYRIGHTEGAFQSEDFYISLTLVGQSNIPVLGIEMSQENNNVIINTSVSI